MTGVASLYWRVKGYEEGLSGQNRKSLMRVPRVFEGAYEAGYRKGQLKFMINNATPGDHVDYYLIIQNLLLEAVRKFNAIHHKDCGPRDEIRVELIDRFEGNNEYKMSFSFCFKNGTVEGRYK